MNRFIIGQQAVLSSNTVPALLTVVTPKDRERGTGEIAGEVVVSETSVSEDNNPSTTVASPSIPTARNDGRGRSPRRRQYNVDFGISNSASLPPLTSNVWNLNVESMEKRFAGIADSIQDLTKHAMVRVVNVLDDDLIKAIGGAG